MSETGGKPPADGPKPGATPSGGAARQPSESAADSARQAASDHGADAFDNGPMNPASFQRIGQRIADLSRDLSQITQLAGAATPRKLELEAATAAFKSLTEAYAKHPEAFNDAQMDLFGRQSDALQNMAAGAPSPEADADIRFSGSDWSDNPFSDFVRRIFVASSSWAESLAWNAPDLSETERRRAAFFIRQAAAAMSPSNLLMANPRAMKAMFETDGQSIQQGFTNLQNDFDSGKGRISVTQTDPEAFELGVTLAVTPGEIVFKNALIELIRYHPTTPTVHENPLLIFPPWINKYYVLDLTPKNSLVAWLRDQGFTVYMVSWRSADDETKDFGWDDYLKLGGRAALDWVSKAHKTKVNAAGYCVGGALLSVLAARLAAEGDDRLASISLLAAQTDFTEPGDLGLFIDANSVDGVAALIDEAGGVMPGEAMRDAFNLLRPEDLIWRYVEERYLLGQAPRAFDLLYWNGDQTNLPGPLHLSSLRRLYLENALATRTFTVEDKPIDLSAIHTPVFIHAARKDHISPFASVYKGVHLFGGDVTFLLADSGHIAGVVNPPAANKYRHWTGEAAAATSDDWLKSATEHPGSWWPLWSAWLKDRSGAEAPPPRKKKGAAAAPGDYVRETLASIADKRGA
jgi:polyhydroxyalkanoate synthase subunit PhaC